MKLNKEDIPTVSFMSENHCTIYTKQGAFLQSYASTVAFRPSDRDKIQLGKDWRRSSTTSKYRNMFLGEKTPITEKKLASGEYELNMML